MKSFSGLDTSKLTGLKNQNVEYPESDSAASEELEIHAKVMPELVVNIEDEQSSELMWDDDEVYMPEAQNNFEP